MKNNSQAKKNLSLLKRLKPYYKPYRKIFALDFLFALLITLVELAFPLLVKVLINEDITENGIVISYILIVGAILLGLKVIDAFANYYVMKVGHIMGAKMERDMRSKLFNHLLEMPHSYYDNTKTGVLMSRITNDLFDVTEFAHHCPEEIFIAIITILGTFTMLMFVNIPLTLIIFAFLPIIIIFAIIFNRKMRNVSRNIRQEMGDINSRAKDSLSGIRVVKSFGGEKLEQEKFEKGNEKLLALKKNKYKNLGIFTSGIRFFDSLLYIVVIVCGAIFLSQNRIDIGDFFLYILFAELLLKSIRRIVEFTEQFQLGISGFERYEQVMSKPSFITEKEDAITHEIEGNIKFDNVSFKYNDIQGDVLTDISFEIEKGQHIAIVGYSGVGKTTICNLIPRFYEVSSGNIYIDDINVKDYTFKSLRKNIGMVQQDIYLFAGTIYENIAYGKVDATNEEVVESAKKAGIHDFIMTLERGYDTYVGEHGVKLSGGQKQRVSIARVFLKNPPVIILDEATSSLDNKAEKVVQKSLEELTLNKTTLTIAHRLSTIKNADKILVLDNEGIVECGTHDELLNRKGKYFELYNARDSID